MCSALLLLFPGSWGCSAVGAESLVVAALPFVSSAPVFLAQSRGFYAREGLEVELRIFQAAQPVSVAVAAGDADFGVTGLTAGFYNLAGKGALQIIAAQSRIEPGHPFIAYLASEAAWRGGLRSLDDLPGRRIGITQKGSTFHYMLGRLAERRGFLLEDLRLITLESVPNSIAALRGGGVDAVLLPSHLARPLAAEGAARVLGWVSEETPWQLGALFTSVRTVERRRSVVERFLRAYRAGAAVYHGSVVARQGGLQGEPGAQALRVARELAGYVDVPPEEILESAPFIDPEARLDVDDIREQVTWYQARGLVDRRIDPASLLASEFILPLSPPAGAP